jgi:polysaccharide biosynthesis protein PelF
MNERVQSDANKGWLQNERRPADVCLIVEGCYPYVPGGVSSWIDWLIRSQPNLTFSIVSLWPTPSDVPPRYKMPPNAVAFHPLHLQDFGSSPTFVGQRNTDFLPLANALTDLISPGGIDALARATGELRKFNTSLSLDALFNSPVAWQVVQRMYQDRMQYSSFLHYFWAWRALLGGLFATLEFQLPEAKVYHTISTGYAGVLAARAGVETGRPVLLTEHGIYTNERRIELLMADWVADTVEKGHALDDPRLDLRDVWIHAFEAYARTCYESCDLIVTLYEDNQRVQMSLGAKPERCKVIANGIDIARYKGLPTASPDMRPTMALIGRVVPIKDIKSFITAAKILRTTVPYLRAWVIGPTDEDPTYMHECEALVAELDLTACVSFTGAVDIAEYLPQIHVVVLTSLSESQPLVLLEAGAAGVPFVANDVGSCREIIFGRSDEQPPLGQGGLITGVVAPAETARAVGSLLADYDLAQRYGATLRQRVERYYRSEQAASAYSKLYSDMIQQPTTSVPTRASPSATRRGRRFGLGA